MRFFSNDGQLCYLVAVLSVWCHMGCVPGLQWWEALSDPASTVPAAVRQWVFWLWSQGSDAEREAADAAMAQEALLPAGGGGARRPRSDTLVAGSSAWSLLQAIAPFCRQGGQQDAHEALMHVLDAVDQVLTGARLPNPFVTRVRPVMSCTHCGARPEPAVRDMETWTCWTLSTPTTNTDAPPPPTPDASLPPRLGVDRMVQDVLGGHVAADYRCAQCQVAGAGLRTHYELHAWPRWWWVTLPRYDSLTGQRLPLDALDIPYQWQPAVADVHGHRPVYTLRGAVLHHGHTIGSGHYTSWVYDAGAGRWVHVDDGRVTGDGGRGPADVQPWTAFMGSGGSVSRHAYLLVYQTAEPQVGRALSDL